MKNFTILMILFIATSTSIKAQEVSQSAKSNEKQIGLIFSTLSGSGLYFMAGFSPKDHIKLTGIYLLDNSKYYNDTFISLGLEYQRNLFKDENKRAYFLVGTGYDKNDYRNSYSNDEMHINFGVGLGLDYTFIYFDKIGLLGTAHITYQYSNELDSVDNYEFLGLGGGIGFAVTF